LQQRQAPIFIEHDAAASQDFLDMSAADFSCRAGCAACCIAPSITSPIPGMPNGKPAGVPCVQLNASGFCQLFGLPERPGFCSSLRANAEMCGSTKAEAVRFLTVMEMATRPSC
jgi:hypothetical protein